MHFNTRGIRIRGRKDQFRIVDRGTTRFRVRGASEIELWISAARPIQELHLEVSSPAPGSHVTFRLGGHRQEVLFEVARPGPVAVTLAPKRATKVRYQWGKRLYAYRLVIETESGRNPRRSDGQVIEPQFYVGAEVIIHRVKWWDS